jgi:hypothetical protein
MALHMLATEFRWISYRDGFRFLWSCSLAYGGVSMAPLLLADIMQWLCPGDIWLIFEYTRYSDYLM